MKGRSIDSLIWFLDGQDYFCAFTGQVFKAIHLNLSFVWSAEMKGGFSVCKMLGLGDVA